MKRRASAALAVTGALAVLVGAGCQAEMGEGPSASVAAREQAIVGGAVTTPGEYPWMAAVSSFVAPEGADPFWSFDCGGSLIARGWVLTAAHCVSSISLEGELTVHDPAFKEVVVGQYDLTNDTTTPDATEQHVAVAEIIVHPGYQYVEETDPELGTRSVKEYNDIALLRLAEEVTINESVRIVKLSSGGDDPGLAASLSGWGDDEAGVPPISAVPVPILKDLSAAIVDPDVSDEPAGPGCNERLLQEAEALGFGQRAIDESTEICMLNASTSAPDYQSACYHDSGSPWVRTVNGCAEQFGIHVFGDYYCVNYDVATRISAYLPWIREQGVDYVGDRVYEAEDVTHGAGGPHPGGWNIWDGSSYIAFNHEFRGGSQEVTVRAEGGQVAGQYPRFRVTVGGTNVYEANLTSATWANYTFTIANAPVGTREVRVSFLNDYYQNGQDRNLFVDKVTIKDSRTTCDAVGEEGLDTELRVTNTWANGYCAEIEVTNTGSAATTDWTLVYTTSTTSIFDSWNPDVNSGTGVHTASPSTAPSEDWLRQIPAGQSRVHGFCANRAPGSTTLPTIISAEAEY